MESIELGGELNIGVGLEREIERERGWSLMSERDGERYWVIVVSR